MRLSAAIPAALRGLMFKVSMFNKKKFILLTLLSIIHTWSCAFCILFNNHVFVYLKQLCICEFYIIDLFI